MIKFIKIAVSVTLIGILLLHVDWREIISHLNSMNITAVTFVFLLMAAQFPISALKWQKALEIHKLNYPFGFLQRVLCIGFFFNNFLPTSIGGDGYRMIRTMPKEGMRSGAVSAVLLERLVGFSALLLLGLVGGLITLTEHRPAIIMYYILACGIGIAAALLFLLLFRTDILQNMKKKLLKVKKLEPIIHNIRYIKQGGRDLLDVIAISILFQLVAIWIIYLLFASMGIEVAFAECALIAAISGLASVLPISINGIGVVEGSFVFAASQFGVDLSQAILVAFMMRILVIPLSAICGLVYLLELRFAD